LEKVVKPKRGGWERLKEFGINQSGNFPRGQFWGLFKSAIVWVCEKCSIVFDVRSRKTKTRFFLGYHLYIAVLKSCALF